MIIPSESDGDQIILWCTENVYLVTSCIVTKIYRGKYVVYFYVDVITKMYSTQLVICVFFLALTAYYKETSLKYQYDICNYYLWSFYHEQMFFVFVIEILSAFLS